MQSISLLMYNIIIMYMIVAIIIVCLLSVINFILMC